MTGKPIDFLGAFVVGGSAGVVGQIFFKLYAGIGMAPMLVPIAMLLSICLISTVLDVFGIYGKITVFGGLGAILPFCGLPPSICMVMRAKLGEGETAGKAILEALKAPAIIFGIGYVFCIAIAIIQRSLAG
jgi:hypothetical protein